MNVIVLFNGLGNQMSQYAFYLNMKQIENETYVLNFCNSDHNGFELNNVFGIKIKRDLKLFFLNLIFRILLTPRLPFLFVPLQKLLNFFNILIIKENFDYSFKSEYLKPTKGIVFYYGGWHHENYFLAIRNHLIETYKFNQTKLSDVLEIENSIKGTQSVSLHVRRGDFLNDDNINLFGGVCTKDYFDKAIEYINKKIDSPHFFVFSNDFEWVNENISLDNFTYITCNSGRDSWKDMYLMSLCKHNIISNSTFSWWSAWLNHNKDKIVISPDRFLNNDLLSDIYPDQWYKVKQ